MFTEFFGQLKELSVKDLGAVSKFLGMRITNDNEKGYYNIDQEVTICEMLRDNGLEQVCSIRTPIGEELCNGWEESVKLVDEDRGDTATIKKFQSRMDSLL